MTDEEEVRRFGKEESGKSLRMGIKVSNWRLPEIQTRRDERDRFFLSVLG
jgi:hypothetical protein